MDTELLYIFSDAGVMSIESLGSRAYCHLVLMNSILKGADSIWDPEVWNMIQRRFAWEGWRSTFPKGNNQSQNVC